MYRPRHRLRQIYIVCTVMDHLTGRMGTEPILPVKQSVSIDITINFDGDGDGDGDGTCKQTLMPWDEILSEHSSPREKLCTNDLCSIFACEEMVLI